MTEVALWVLLGAVAVFLLIKVAARDAFLPSLICLVVIAAAGVVPATVTDHDVSPLVWGAAIPAVVAGWLLRPLNAVAGPIRGKGADGGVYHYTDEDRSILRRARLLASWKPLAATALVILCWSFVSPWSALVGAAAVGFALAALAGILSRRLTGLLEVRTG